MKNLLLKDFYSIREVEVSSPEKMIVKVELNAAHPVYKGHFPEIAVAPGVCLIQMIKEVIMQQHNKNLRMSEGDNIKFMALVDPNRNQTFYIDYQFTYPSETLVEASAILRWESVIFLKFKGKFSVIEK